MPPTGSASAEKCFMRPRQYCGTPYRHRWTPTRTTRSRYSGNRARSARTAPLVMLSSGSSHPGDAGATPRWHRLAEGAGQKAIRQGNRVAGGLDRSEPRHARTGGRGAGGRSLSSENGRHGPPDLRQLRTRQREKDSAASSSAPRRSPGSTREVAQMLGSGGGRSTLTSAPSVSCHCYRR